MIVLPCDKKGAGPIPVVFLHGYCEGRWVWADALPDPGSRYTFLAYDLPGFGDAAVMPEAVTMESVASVVLDNIRSVTDVPPVVIGHSLGGYVALAMAAALPSGLSGLGLIHSTIFPDSEEKKENRNKVAASVRANGPRPFLETFADGLFTDPGSGPCQVFKKRAAVTSAGAIADYATAMRDRPDRSHGWKQLSCPLLLVAGRHDRLTTPEMMQTIAQCNMSPTRFVILERSAHMGMMEEPLALQMHLSEYLSLIASA